MDYYHVWCNLKDSSKDLQFATSVHKFLDFMRDQKHIADYSITRRKLGFGPAELGEFHIVMAFERLAQLDGAFEQAASRAGVVEELHRSVYSVVTDFKSALYRDFPDPVRRS